MRKPSDVLLRRQRRLASYALRRTAKRKARERKRRRRRLAGIRLQRVTFGATIVQVPTLLLFHGTDKTRQAFDAFIREVGFSLAMGRHVRLDFAKTKQLFPCGLLLFLGWLDEWLGAHPGKLTCTYPDDDLVEQMLQSAKVLIRMGQPPRKVVSHDDVTRWHQFEGHEVDATPIEPFLIEVRDATDLEWQMGLGGCISEALTNVKKHAYSNGVSSRWWMFATVNVERRQVFVAMLDRGESIPGTLLAKPGVLDVISMRMLRRGGDCELISAAAGGRTRTKLYYRGKGLPEMVEFTERDPANALALYSRMGYFHQRGLGQIRGTLKQPVKGTLVIWTLNYGAQP